MRGVQKEILHLLGPEAAARKPGKEGRKEGRKAGRKEGRKAGRKEGRKEGRNVCGRKEGAEEVKKETREERTVSVAIRVAVLRRWPPASNCKPVRPRNA